jgi:hypothetical protein
MDNPEKLATLSTPGYTICVGHHYVQTNTNNVNNTRSVFSNVYLQKTMEKWKTKNTAQFQNPIEQSRINKNLQII